MWKAGQRVLHSAAGDPFGRGLAGPDGWFPQKPLGHPTWPASAGGGAWCHPPLDQVELHLGQEPAQEEQLATLLRVLPGPARSAARDSSLSCDTGCNMDGPADGTLSEVSQLQRTCPDISAHPRCLPPSVS